jgi:hypothetical protein
MKVQGWKTMPFLRDKVFVISSLSLGRTGDVTPSNPAVSVALEVDGTGCEHPWRAKNESRSSPEETLTQLPTGHDEASPAGEVSGSPGHELSVLSHTRIAVYTFGESLAGTSKTAPSTQDDACVSSGHNEVK